MNRLKRKLSIGPVPRKSAGSVPFENNREFAGAGWRVGANDPPSGWGCLMKIITAIILFFFLASSAIGAVVVKDAYGFGGYVHIENYVNNGSGAALVTTPTLPTGASCDSDFLECSSTKTDSCFTSWPLSQPASDSTYTHIGFWFSIDYPDIVTDTSVDFFSFGPDQAANPDVQIRISSTGGGTEHSVHIINANGGVVTTNNDVFTEDTWYWIDVFYQRGDTSKACWLYITEDGDETRDLIGSGTGQDYNNGSGSGTNYGFILDQQHDASAPFVGASKWRFKNLVVEYGISSVPSDGTFRVASCMAVPYKSGTTSDTGSNIDTGDWANVSDSNITTNAGYTTSASGGIDVDDDTSGGIAGPNGQFGSGVTVLGGKWSVRASRTKTGVGSNGLLYGKYDGSTRTTTTVAGCSSGTFCNISAFEDTSGARLPAIDEWFESGVQNSLLVGTCAATESRCWFFTSFPYDEELVSLIDRVPFRALNRATRVGE